MFSRDQLKRLKKPRRERAQSAPVIPVFRGDNSDSSDNTDRRFVFARRRKQPDNGIMFHQSARRFIDHEESSSLSLDEHITAAAPLSSSMPPTTRKNTTNKRHDPLVKALVAALQKEHMLDVTLVGKDGARVRASRYVLACRCESLENKLYKNAAATCTQAHSQDEKVYIGDYSEVALRGLVEYCFTGELSEFWKHHASVPQQNAVECIVELSKCAHEYRFRLLKQEVYQLSRRLMNQHPTMACLFYNHSEASTEMTSYAQTTIQECPREALFGSDSLVASLTPERLESLFCNDTLEDLPEMDKVRVLQLWSDHVENDFQVARHCAAQYIDLQRIRLDEDTVATLKESGLFDNDSIPEAMQTVSFNEEEEEQCNVERVVVEGAGMESINGIYYRDNEEEDEEAMYVSSCGSTTLYCWNGTWHIAASIDLSNSLYQCVGECVSSVGWQSVGAVEPAPRCTWLPAVVQSPPTPIVEEEETSDEELPAYYDTPME